MPSLLQNEGVKKGVNSNERDDIDNVGYGQNEDQAIKLFFGIEDDRSSPSTIKVLIN